MSRFPNCREYPQDLKEQVVSMVLNGKRVCEISKDMDIPDSTIHGWLKKAKDLNPTDYSKENVNMSQLLKELRDVREERDILKKALAIFSKRPGQNSNL